MFSYNGPMARYVCSEVAIEHDKHNSKDSNQILLSDKDRKYSSYVAHRHEVCCLRFPGCSCIASTAASKSAQGRRQVK